MSKPVQITKTVTTAGTGVYVPLDFPSPAVIMQVIIATDGGFNATLYNRELVGALKNVQAIIDNGSGKARIILDENVAHNFQVGDTVTVASSGVVAYNVNHVVTVVPNNSEVHTSVNYTVDDNPSDATVKLNLPAADHPAYEVLELTAAVSNVVRWTGWRVFRSEQKDLDSLHRPLSRLYLLLSAAKTYVISIRGDLQMP
jgi:hypothetical protein